MIIRACRSRKIGSKVIRALSNSDYSHIIIENQGYFFQSKMMEGVVCSNEKNAMKGQSEWCDIDLEFTEEQDKKSFDFLIYQIGKPYDFGGAAAIPFIKTEGWQKDNKWFCSELAYAAMVAAGYEPFYRRFSNRVSPQHLLMLPFERRYNKKVIL